MGKKQFLNSMYKRGTSQFDPNTRKYIPMTNDALIYTEKDVETHKTELKIIEKPYIDFYIANTQQKFHKFSMPLSEVHKVTVPYADRDKEIARALGCLDDFYNSKRNGSGWEYKKNIMKHPNLYMADVDIEDFYKTKMMLLNGEDAVSGVYEQAFSDTEVDISRFQEDFPDPNVAPCPICLITCIYMNRKECISYILYDERTKNDIEDVTRNPKQFINEYLDPIIVNEGLSFNFKVFYKEEDLIRTYFKDTHERKPDFMGWWNMSFDIPTILNRLRRLGYSDRAIAEIICHPDVPDQYKYVKYNVDPKRNEMNGKKDQGSSKDSDDSSDDDEEDGDDEDLCDEDDGTGGGRGKSKANRPNPSRYVDWFEAPGYTQHYCQMAMFSNLRKRFLYPSYKLDDIGKTFAGIGKYNLHEGGYSIKDCNVKNFKIFLAYNIRDSFVQYMLEKKNNDIANYIIFSSNTRLSKGHQMSVVIKNDILKYLLKKNEVSGNAIDYGITEHFPGAIVGRPELIEQEGISIEGKSSFVFENAVDMDASSLYPSMMILFNICKPALFGRVMDVYNPVNDKSLGKGEGLFSQIETIDQSLFDLCSKYMGLPTPQDLIKTINESVETKQVISHTP